MSAELLRRAAALVRERAEAATPGPWGVGNGTHVATDVEQTSRGSFRFGWMIAEIEDDEYREYGGPRNYDEDGPLPPASAEADAEHIASWHPAVALAVADWLEVIARRVDEVNDSMPGSLATRESICRGTIDGYIEACAVARAYLGADA